MTATKLEENTLDDSLFSVPSEDKKMDLNGLVCGAMGKTAAGQ